MISKISISSNRFEAPSSADIDAARAELLALLNSNKATIRVKSGTTAAMHFETHNSKDGVVEIHYLDLQLLAEELLEFGSAISVIQPSELREVMDKILEDVTKLYA